MRAGSSIDGAEGASGGGHGACSGNGDMWTPVRAALRYVTQKPWNRIPALTRTFMFNPVIACLAGGRNKVRGKDQSVTFISPGCWIIFISPAGWTNVNTHSHVRGVPQGIVAVSSVRHA
jgi:hypothetical protein